MSVSAKKTPKKAAKKAVQKPPVKQKVVKVVKKSEITGATYDRTKGGTTCPMCLMPKPNVTHSLPWESGFKVRYHCCPRCGSRFKSVEEK